MKRRKGKIGIGSHIHIIKIAYGTDGFPWSKTICGCEGKFTKSNKKVNCKKCLKAIKK